MTESDSGFTYRQFGVDIEGGDRFADYIRAFPSPAISKGLGGFAGGFELDTGKFENPLILTTTDGVGTKILVARHFKIYNTIGIDLVAMCVNDLAVCGAFPEVFLDYIACGSLNESVLKEIMKGIIRGCEEAECSLAGGETAEMPDMYKAEEFDLAGFAVGVGEKNNLLPKKDLITPGDLIFALPSSGIHSNGLSLARNVITPEEADLYRNLLTPTRIYVKELKILFETGCVLAAAHITGGGLAGNLARVLPAGFKPRFTYSWKVPDIFTEIQKRGPVSEEEMRRVFNMGIGIALVARSEHRDALEKAAEGQGFDLPVIGEIVHA